MIDCGEGTQVQMRRMRIGFNRLNHIFISHLHGDHCFGLPGLISTLSMLGRTRALCLYGPEETGHYLFPILEQFNKKELFEVCFTPVDTRAFLPIMEDRSMTVYSIPLHHRIPTCGFLFEEKPKEAHLIGEMIEFYQVPVRLRAGIKQGDDFVTPEGEVVPNARLTRPADPPKRYAYCSDTAFYPDIVPYIRNVDTLYHEATFVEAERERAKATFHSTAAEAAEIARRAQVKQLVIGHFSARYENDAILKKEADQTYPGTILANEGMVISV
jgi:ribonuclease Z